MNYENLLKQIENGLYPSYDDMKANIDYALKRKKINAKQHAELIDLLKQKEQEQKKKK